MSSHLPRSAVACEKSAYKCLRGSDILGTKNSSRLLQHNKPRTPLAARVRASVLKIPDERTCINEEGADRARRSRGLKDGVDGMIRCSRHADSVALLKPFPRMPGHEYYAVATGKKGRAWAGREGLPSISVMRVVGRRWRRCGECHMCVLACCSRAESAVFLLRPGRATFTTLPDRSLPAPLDARACSFPTQLPVWPSPTTCPSFDMP